VYTLDEARAALAAVRPRIDALVDRRADLTELNVDLLARRSSPFGRLADAKAAEAWIHAELERIAETGVQIKGFAPLLLDYPGERDGVPVLWCWVEGEADIAWYHRADCGFPGRRRV